MVSTEILAEIPFFSDLTPEEREFLSPIANEVTAKPGELFFEEGSASHNLRILRSGFVSLRQKVDEEHDAQMLALSSPGDLFGISALLGDKGIHPYSAICVEETDVIVIDAKSWWRSSASASPARASKSAPGSCRD
jgi:signal-transduction protein with cAMP-binding, CBS, and nucleotidyltransferase domain